MEDQYAWDFIYQQAVACKGELEIVAIGPLTNVANALLKYPNLKDYVKRISIMGGAKGLGNWTAAAEFNIWADPHAAKIVFASGIPMAMMGLDICFKAYVTADDLARIRAAGGPVAEVAAELIGERVGYAEKNGRLGGILCDAVTAAYVMDESVVQTVDVHVDVETRGILTEGKTVITYKHTEDRHFPPNTKMGEDVDRPRFIDLIVNSPVSYTHLDVYKRQQLLRRRPGGKRRREFLRRRSGRERAPRPGRVARHRLPRRRGRGALPSAAHR